MPPASSPEEEEEEIEESLPSARVPLPSSVTKDLLRASASRSSRGGTSMTPTPRQTTNKEARGSVAATAARIIAPGDERGASTSSSSRARTEKSPVPYASSSRSPLQPGRVKSKRGDYENAEEIDSVVGDSDGSAMFEAVPHAGPSRRAHGPRSESTDPLILDAGTLSPASSSSLTPLPSSSVRIANYKGAPYVEIPYLPLNRLKRYSNTANIRFPTALSRHQQINFDQTPPLPSDDSDFEIVAPEQSAVSTKVPRWRTRTETESSPDLGGYGSESEDEEDSEDSEEEGIPRTRRSTRTKGKGKQMETRRTTRGHKQVSVLVNGSKAGPCIGREPPVLHALSIV